MTGPIAKGTIRTSFVLGLRLIVQAGTLLIVARMLGPQQFGAFAGIAALAVILGTLSTFGTHLVLLGEISKKPARRAEVLPYAIPTTLLCGGLLLVIYVAIALLVLPETNISITVLLAIGITETQLQPLLSLCVAEHHGKGLIARSQLLVILPLALRLTVAVAVFGLKTPNPLTAYALGYGIASLVALVLAFLTLSSPWPPPTQWRLLTRGELHEATGFAVLGLTRMGPAELDKTLAVQLLPLAAAGVYTAGARVIAATTLPVSAMTLASLPRLFRDGDDAHDRTRHLSRHMLVVAGIYGTGLAVVLWLFAPLLEYVFGAHYTGITTLTRLLCPAIPGMTLRLVAGSILVAVRHPVLRTVFEATGIALIIVASILLVPRLGSTGMAVALSASEWTMALIGIVMTFRVLRQSISSDIASIVDKHPS